MVLNVLIWVIILWCAVKTVGYGVYTFKKDNKSGGVSVIFLAAAVLASSAVFV